MAQIDWSDNVPPPGLYLVEVTSSQEKVSKKGDTMFAVVLAGVEDKRLRSMDYIMLQGKGGFIGRAKLLALGFEKGTKEIRAAELVGRRVWANMVHEEYNGEINLKAKAPEEGDGGFYGYWPEAEPPEGVEPVRADGDAFTDDDSPF